MIECLLDELAVTVRRYVVVTPAQACAIALWTAHTHAFDAAEATPYLHISSAEKRSGKSTLLSVLEVLVAKPWRAITPSEAVVYRKIAASTPTLLLDEVDAIYGPKTQNHEGLRAMLNAGFQGGTTVPRCVGDGSKIRVEEFSVFCPKALAGIGGLPDTVADRAIRIELKRKAPDEAVDRCRRREVRTLLGPLRETLGEWASENVDALATARPPLPEALDDRAADVWEPLLAIADVAGGEWTQRAREASLELSGPGAREDESLGVQLLTDIRRVFEERGSDRISSAEICAELANEDESPWADWRGSGGINAKALARMLRPYGIRSATIRLDDSTAKGYKRGSFADAWARYAPVNGAANVTPSQPAWEAGLRLFSERHARGDVSDANGPDSAWIERCDVVTAGTPGKGATPIIEELNWR